jgi:hypothetical protein
LQSLFQFLPKLPLLKLFLLILSWYAPFLREHLLREFRHKNYSIVIGVNIVISCPYRCRETSKVLS